MRFDVELEVVVDWCDVRSHPRHFTVERPPTGPDDANEDADVLHNANQPVACLSIAGVAVCIVCLELQMPELARIAALQTELLCRKAEVLAAVAAAEELTA